MFPNRIRGQAVALASFTQWVFNFLVVLLFPYVLDALGGSSTFLFLSLMSVIQLIMVLSFSRKPRGRPWKKLSSSGNKLEIGISLGQIQLLDPDIAIEHIMAFCL